MCWKPIFRRWKNSMRLPEAIARNRRQRLSHRAGRLRQVLHLLRGALYARAGIFARARSASWPKRAALAAQGVREIVLLGQNVNAYRGAGADGKAWTWRG